MKRVGRKDGGEFVHITWDEALNIIAERLREIKEKYGAEAVSVFRGQASD
jgi:anaerobic dimethyl sulfoxide reductase subunit A